MEDNQLQKGFPPVSVRLVGMGELTVYMVYEHELAAIERGSPATTMVSLAISLLSIAAGLLGSLMLSGAPVSIYRFIIFSVLLTLCSITGVVLLILSRRFRREPSDIIKCIRARKEVPTGPVVMAQVVDSEDEETH